MASQQPRPAWFRLSAIANRPAAPAPNPEPAPPPPPVAQLAPIRPPAPVPAIVRPTIPLIPIRPSLAPTQTQEPAPPSPPAVASLPSTAAPPPAAAYPPSTAAPPPAVASPPSAAAPPPATPPRSPVATPAQTASRSPTKAPTLTAAPPSSPTTQVAASPRSPVVAPAPQLSPRVPAAALPSQTLPPPPTYTAPQPTSPVPKAPLTNSTNGTAVSSSITASPKTKTKSPSYSMPTPVPRPMASAAGLTATGNLNSITPNSSPKIVKQLEKTPAQSPKVKPLSNPPSPFTLPPVQKTEDEIEPQIPAEVEQKRVLVQETIEKPMKMPNTHNASASNEKRDPAMKVRGNGKKNSDTEELGMRVITLAGENKGAVMELSSSQKKKYPVGNPQSSHKNKHNNISGKNGDQSSSESGEEGKSNKKDKTNRAMAMKSPPMTAFLNSNVQGVNNSILYNCHCRHNDPGVHLSLTKKTNGNHSKDHHG